MIMPDDFPNRPGDLQQMARTRYTDETASESPSSDDISSSSTSSAVATAPDPADRIPEPGSTVYLYSLDRSKPLGPASGNRFSLTSEAARVVRVRPGDPPGRLDLALDYEEEFECQCVGTMDRWKAEKWCIIGDDGEGEYPLKFNLYGGERPEIGDHVGLLVQSSAGKIGLPGLDMIRSRVVGHPDGETYLRIAIPKTEEASGVHFCGDEPLDGPGAEADIGNRRVMAMCSQAATMTSTGRGGSPPPLRDADRR